jgi:hypothetical protein
MNLELKYGKIEDICQRDVRALAGKITPAVLAEAAKRTGVVLVKSPLCLGNLVWLGIACALHMSLDFACILTMTLKLLEDQQAFYSSELGKARRNGQRQERGKAGKTGKGKHGKSKHCPQRDDPTRLSEEAFVKARRRMPLAFWVNLIIILGEQFQEQHRSLLTFHGDRLLAVDGTCIDMANWKRLRDYFGTAKNARGRQSVQARMVMLQFPFIRLLVEAAVKHAIDPLRLSFKNALRELFAMHSSLVIAQGRWVHVSLEKLLDRVAEHQVPYRPGRSYPRRKQSSNHKRKSKHPRGSKTTKAPQSRNRKPKAAKRQRAKSSKKG